MKNIERDLLGLLTDERALTILKLEDGWMITFSDLTQEGEELFFIPNKIMLSESSLEEALSVFHGEQLMDNVAGYQA